MKKILHVTRNLPPLVGGMEKLNFNVLDALRAHYDVAVSGPIGSFAFHGLHNYAEFSARPLWRYLISSFFKTAALAIKCKPDVVFCGSGAAVLAGYFSARLSGASLVCYLHGLDLIVDSKIYQWFFLPLIRRCDLVLVNSNHTCMLAARAHIDDSCIRILSPGADLPNLSLKEAAAHQFRLQYGIGDAPFILIAGRMTERKGIAEFISNVMPTIVITHPKLKLVIIGDEAVNAMKKSSGVKDRILESVNKFNLSNSVKLIGSVDDNMLSAGLFAAEMLIFPVLDIANDVEGFGMVAVEAAAHGLPTVGFSVGGIPDAIAHNRSGWLVSPGDYSQMCQTILDACSPNNSDLVTSESCVAFAEQFSWARFKKNLIEILES